MDNKYSQPVIIIDSDSKGRLFWFLKVVRFVISGGSAAVVHLSVLWFLTDILDLWYLISGVVAFLVAFVVSFLMQKYWTFKNRSVDKIKTQTGTYFFIAVFNLGLNTFMLYLFVEIFHVHYLLAQLVIGAVVAVWSYFAYSHFVFKQLK